MNSQNIYLIKLLEIHQNNNSVIIYIENLVNEPSIYIRYWYDSLSKLIIFVSNSRFRLQNFIEYITLINESFYYFAKYILFSLLLNDFIIKQK